MVEGKIPLGDATIVEHRVPGRDGRRLDIREGHDFIQASQRIAERIRTCQERRRRKA